MGQTILGTTVHIYIIKNKVKHNKIKITIITMDKVEMYSRSNDYRETE
jgi:hypothetical protein